MPALWHIEDAPTPLQLHGIARVLLDGGVVLLPTDTIYGFHAVATNCAAVERIGSLKGRDDTKPYVVIVSESEQLSSLGVTAPPDLIERLDAIWPAPLTVVLPIREGLPASRGLPTLAVRIPDLRWLRELVSVTGPLVSTSANRAGEAPLEEPSALARDLQNGIDAIVDAGPKRAEPSAILDLTRDEPAFIREGEFSFTQKVWKSLRKSL